MSLEEVLPSRSPGGKEWGEELLDQSDQGVAEGMMQTENVLNKFQENDDWGLGSVANRNLVGVLNTSLESSLDTSLDSLLELLDTSCRDLDISLDEQEEEEIQRDTTEDRKLSHERDEFRRQDDTILNNKDTKEFKKRPLESSHDPIKIRTDLSMFSSDCIPDNIVTSSREWHEETKESISCDPLEVSAKRGRFGNALLDILQNTCAQSKWNPCQEFLHILLDHVKSQDLLPPPSLSPVVHLASTGVRHPASKSRLPAPVSVDIADSTLSTDKTDGTDSVSLRASRRPFHCPVCEGWFRTSTVLQHHLAKMHFWSRLQSLALPVPSSLGTIYRSLLLLFQSSPFPPLSLLHISCPSCRCPEAPCSSTSSSLALMAGHLALSHKVVFRIAHQLFPNFRLPGIQSQGAKERTTSSPSRRAPLSEVGGRQAILAILANY